MKKLISLKNVVISLAALILIWQLLFTVSSYDKALFPSPKMALDALVEMVYNGKLAENISTSMYRFATGYLSSVLAAVVLGLILGRIP
ncbi:MAG: ABC transporter permease, partial [Ruminococcus sp.]|nr:ABC transporter permease [Ruminococcus sp.]